MARRSSALLACLAVTLASGCTQVVDGTASSPPTGRPYINGINVDNLLLTTEELRDITGAGLDLSDVPGMDSTQPVDDELLVDHAPPECQFVFRETQTFRGVVQFHKTSFQTPPKSALLSEAAAAYDNADAARGAFTRVGDLITACGERTSGATYVATWTADADAVRAESAGDCGRIYRLAKTVLVEVTYCGYSHVVPDLVATRIASRVTPR